MRSELQVNVAGFAAVSVGLEWPTAPQLLVLFPATAGPSNTDPANLCAALFAGRGSKSVAAPLACVSSCESTVSFHALVFLPCPKTGTRSPLSAYRD